MKKIILFQIFVLIHIHINATTYYVSNSGDDNNIGTTPKTPFKTLAKINALILKPGDNVLLKRGDTWREFINISNSGNYAHRITFSSYGTGKKPQIVGSEQSATWTNQGGKIWKSVAKFTANPYTLGAKGGGNVWLITHDTVNTGVYKPDTAALQFKNEWSYSGNSIYLYAESDPSTRYDAIEVMTRNTGISLNHNEYITVDGIDILYTGVCIYEGYISKGGHGLIVRNCELAYTGYPDGNSAGIHFCYNNSLIENNSIHDQGRRGISLVNVASSLTIKDITVRNNTFYHGYHTTSVDLQLSHGFPGSIDDVHIYNNLIYDEVDRKSPVYPMQMFISNQGATGKITNIEVFNNVFKGTTGAAINIGGANDVKVFNNTFYMFNEVTRAPASFLFMGGSKVDIKNNIFYSQLPLDLNGKGFMFVVSADSKITSDYNCYYRVNPRLKLYHIVNEKDYTIRDSVIIRSQLGWESHSIFKDPKIKSMSDLSLQSISPCKSAGIDVGKPHKSSVPDIGFTIDNTYEKGREDK